MPFVYLLVVFRCYNRLQGFFKCNLITKLLKRMKRLKWSQSRGAKRCQRLNVDWACLLLGLILVIFEGCLALSKLWAPVLIQLWKLKILIFVVVNCIWVLLVDLLLRFLEANWRSVDCLFFWAGARWIYKLATGIINSVPVSPDSISIKCLKLPCWVLEWIFGLRNCVEMPSELWWGEVHRLRKIPEISIIASFSQIDLVSIFSTDPLSEIILGHNSHIVWNIHVVIKLSLQLLEIIRCSLVLKCF